ncbi:MAG: Asp-tRNA(Asn)/Glu-tRNA(Gln) amidotransferase subunit GatB [bacterium]|nr:Asp-tRNA(Asn)/Glu-tRNA(Gln) amidotransferase subunit GatB [bacterium]
MMMKTYIPTIGLEIHAELKTATKMFCACANAPFTSEPNANVCPICMGHPGTLPVINKKAVESVLRVGTAIGATLADFTEFDRKNYFYPDIPKGYQLSQYKYPLVSGGEVSGVQITRVHLEEDTASSVHDSQDERGGQSDYSLVDFNRAGVPLMELVTEPVIHSAEQAGDFGRELQLLLRTLGVSEANMEKGEMRVEVNISVASEEDTAAKKFGTKVEVKNLNSFKAAEKAIEYETKRHIQAIENGETIVQETRGWDDGKGSTYSQRKKEDSHDYRYFPDPDLPKLKISEIPEFSADNLRKSLPELPNEKRERYAKLGLKPVEIHIYVHNPEVADFFEAAGASVLASNYIASDLLGLIKKKHGEGKEALIAELPFGPKEFASLIQMIEGKKVSSRGAKDILAVMFDEGGEPMKIAETRDLLQKSDEGAIKKIADEVVAENPVAVEEYKKGKQASLMFLVGQGMKKSKGSANPEMLKAALLAILA